MNLTGQLLLLCLVYLISLMSVWNVPLPHALHMPCTCPAHALHMPACLHAHSMQF